VENDCKGLWPARQFREAVRHESVTDDHAKWKGRKSAEEHSEIDGACDRLIEVLVR
jgi:hypothetical protein